jgi:hypothetical protein
MKKSVFFTLVFLSPVFLYSYKVAYSIPTSNSAAQHEVLTARAMYHLCNSEGQNNLKKYPVFSALFQKDNFFCEELSMDFDPDKFVENIKKSPVAGLMLGSRWPDLMEITGVDADMQDLTVVKYSSDVQFDSYRIYPHLHAQLSKYHNIFGGDMYLAVRVMREYVRSLFYSSLMLMISYDTQKAYSNMVTAYSSFLHDTGMGGPDYWFEVPWHLVVLGRYSHMTADGFSHDSIRMLDIEKNKIPHNSIFYGKFKDESNSVFTAGDKRFTDHIDLEMSGAMGDFGSLTESFFYSKDHLKIENIPEFETIGGKQVKNYYTDSSGRLFMARELSTTLSIYSYYEFIDIILKASVILDDPESVEELINSYIEKWWDYDFEAIGDLAPVATQDVAAIDGRYYDLPWHQYHFVDLWTQSGHSDIIYDRFQAFIMPWTDRNSMDDKLKDEALFGKRFVINLSETEKWDPDTKVFEIDRKKLYLFKSWHRIENSFCALDIDPSLHYYEDNGEIKVKEIEIDPDLEEPFNSEGLNSVYAYAYVPKGWRLCLMYAGDGSGKKISTRTDWYDSRKPYYRCFYGTDEGESAHVNFHIRAGTRLFVLPIDPDFDGIPFLKGIKDDIYQDNCPLDFNPDQNITPCIEEEKPDEEETRDNETADTDSVLEEIKEEADSDNIKADTEETVPDSDSSDESETEIRNKGCSILSL